MSNLNVSDTGDFNIISLSTSISRTICSLVVSKTNALFIQNILKWIKKSIYNRTSNEKQFKIWTLKLVFAKSRQCVENVKTTGCWGWNEQL